MRRSGPAPTQPPSDAPPRDLAAEAVELFQPHYAEQLSYDDGKAITRNFVDVLTMLADWKREATPRAPDPAPDVATNAGTSPAKPPRRPRGRKFPAEVP